MSNESTYHISVLPAEVIEYLNPQPGKLYVDATFGGGGHTRAILEKEPTCRVLALDWDKEAIKKNAEPLKEEYGDRFQMAWGNFAHLDRILEKEKIDSIDGLLADFGTSQHQIHQEKGFSFQSDSPLDMRMSTSHSRVTAATILNSFSEKELADIFYIYGEETRSRRIAKTIYEFRKKTAITRTRQLAELIEKLYPTSGYRRIHPATKVFQALRIYVNKELENIEILLPFALQFLAPGGRLVFISFHSLEDRIVKLFFRNNKDSLQILTKKPVMATFEEIKKNSSSRSAKLRAAEKTK
jgi:16S rRNA (cytosine1402-N4)-methyltransferase